MFLIKGTYPAVHGKASQELLAAYCSPQPAPLRTVQHWPMWAPGLPCIPQWGRGPGCRGSWGTWGWLELQEAPCWSLQHPSPSPCPRAQPQTAGRQGWSARKWQQGTFPRDIVRKEPESGALWPNLSHWWNQEKKSTMLSGWGENLLPRLGAMELPSTSPALASWGAASPAWLPAVGGRPAEPGWHCWTRLYPLPPSLATSRGQPKTCLVEPWTQSSFLVCTPSKMLRLSLASCSHYSLNAFSKHFLGVAFSQLPPPAADSFAVNIYVWNSKNFLMSLVRSVLWHAGWLNNYSHMRWRAWEVR